MKRPATILLLTLVFSLILGWNVGSFFAGRSAEKLVSQIPGSPVVINAKYDKEKHSIIYSVLNPGGMPLNVVEESFVFTPGKESKEKSYIVSHVPVHVVLPPGTITEVELKLKTGTEKLKVGDAVLATFTYVHPLSKDLYNVIHPFTLKPKEKGGK
jgi:hypothetical protein